MAKKEKEQENNKKNWPELLRKKSNIFKCRNIIKGKSLILQYSDYIADVT